MGTPPAKNDHERAKRDIVQGWSNQSIRSNNLFLYSVLEEQLPAFGYAFTLTQRECPATGQQYQNLRDRFVKRLRRIPEFELLHWVIEWQPRENEATAAPHLHGCVFFTVPIHPDVIIRHWLQLVRSEGYTAVPQAQHCVPIVDALGWLQYLSKHAARGLAHYQRDPAHVPPGWRVGGTGRMWGKSGEWPVQPPHRYRIQKWVYFPLRRWMSRYRLSKARQALRSARTPLQVIAALRRISAARRSRKCSDRNLSEVRGVSEWSDGYTVERMLLALHNGYGDVMEGGYGREQNAD